MSKSMATTANAPIPRFHREYVFDELGTAEKRNCELCKSELASYVLRRPAINDVLPKSEVLVCRVCAGMILVTGGRV